MRRTLHPAVFWPLAVLGIVAGACLLAAPTHALLMDLGAMPRHPVPQDLDRDFLRVFRRLLLVPLLLVFLWRVRPFERGVARRYGLAPTGARLRTAAAGYVVTAALLVGVLAWQMAAGWLRWEDPLRWGELGRRAGTYLAGGLLAGLLEEWFFRGWLLDRAERDLGRRWAAPVAAAVYAAVHAFRPSTLTVAVSHDAAGAFQALLGWLGVVLDVQAFGPAALGLFCFALLLTAARRRWDSLWPGIGIHAGAVLVLFSYGAVTDRLRERTWAGTRLVYDGPVVWALALAGAWWLARRRPPGSPEPAGAAQG